MLELVHEKCLMIIKRDRKFDAKKKEIIKRKNSASYYFSKARKSKKQEKVNVQ